VVVAHARLILAAVLVAGAAAANALRFAEPSHGSTLELSSLRLDAGGDGDAPAFADLPLDARFLEMLRAEEVVFRTYAPETEAPVWVFLGYFDRQKEGSQVHSPRHCYPGSGWSVLGEARVQAPWGGDRIRELTVSDGTQTRIVYYWFQTPQGVIDSVFGLKLQISSYGCTVTAKDCSWSVVAVSAYGWFRPWRVLVQSIRLSVHQTAIC